MKPYGAKHVGPVCKWGCCWYYTVKTSPHRSKRYAAEPLKKRARRNGREEIEKQLK